MKWKVARAEPYPQRPGDPAAVWKTLYEGEETYAREIFAACYGVMRRTDYLILFKGDEIVFKVYFKKRIHDARPI